MGRRKNMPAAPDSATPRPGLRHIRRVSQLRRRIAAADSLSADLSRALDGSSSAVFMTDARGRVTYLNRAASWLVASVDGVRLAEGCLRATRPADTTTLARLIAQAASDAPRPALDGMRPMSIRRPSGRRPLSAVVSPLSRFDRVMDDEKRAAVVVVIVDPDARREPDEDDLRAAFRLTPAEAKLTRLLAAGLTLGAAATKLGLRRETARTRVKAIFRKTDTRRQAELVRLVLHAVPQACPW